MTKILATAAGLALAAGAASANPHLAQNVNGATGIGDLSTRGVTNTIVNVDISGNSNFSVAQSGLNTVVEYDLAAALGLASGSSVTMTSIGWDVNITTFGGSWLSEAQIYFDDNIAPDGMGLFLSPGIADGFGGTNVNYASGGQIDLSDNAIPNIVLSNGILRLEFADSFDDADADPDSIWESGSVLFVGVDAIPAPGAAAVFGLAGIAGLRRRR